MDTYCSFSPLAAHLDMVSTFVQKVSTSLDPLQIGQTALAIFSETFHPSLLALYQSHPPTGVLRLLCALPGSDEPVSRPLAQILVYDTPSLLTDMTRHRTPILVTDLHDPILAEAVALEGNFADQHTRGCLCVPLWNGSSFEGGLLATFTTPLAPTDYVAQTIAGCALHLATALSNARLYLTAENERTRQRAILDQLPEGALITEAISGSISYANEVAAQILDASLDTLVGSPLHALTHAIRPHPHNTRPFFPWTFAVIRALGGEIVNQMEAIALRPDGTYVPVLCSSSPLRASQGMITGAIVMFQDITRQKNLETQKNLFFSLASHELRTPLTTVMGYAELLHHVTTLESVDQLDLPTLRLASQHICVQAEQMAYLIDEMLDLSRLDHGHLVMQTTSIDLLSLVRRVIQNLAATAPRHQFHLALEGWDTSTQVTVQADTIHLTQVLNSLVSNAIKYSPHGGKIEVGLSRQESAPTSALLWVKDHGLGIAQADLPHLFTRFYRASTLDSSISGLGIGLYLVKEIVERHGGQVQVVSAEGEGSTFSFSLPLAPCNQYIAAQETLL